MPSNHDIRYVSKSPLFMMHIRGPILDYYTDENGNARQREKDPELHAEFQRLVLASTDANARYDRAFATRTFFPRASWRDTGAAPGHAILGAVPSMHPQAMFEPTGDGKQKFGGMTNAYDPTTHFGVYYLNWEPNPNRRVEIEKALDEHGLNGIEYVRVTPESIIAPWPTYDDMRKGAGADKAVLAAVRTMGLSPFVVLEYELAMADTKSGIVARMEELAAEQAEAVVDQAGLERVL